MSATKLTWRSFLCKVMCVAILLMMAPSAMAQQSLTKDQILNMTTDELSELSLEELMQAVEVLGVTSVDELFALIMNKNVSSASKSEEDSFVSPLSTTVITKAEMRTYGISTLEEAFRLIPGMIVTEKLNGMYDVQMRGLNNIPDNNMLLYTENSNVLLMIDGKSAHNYTMGILAFDFLPISIEDIDRIEVVRGACGSLYGANAVSGAINIITEKPDQGSKKVAGSIQMGNNNTFVGDVALRNTWANGKFSAGVTFNMQHRGRATDKLYVPANSDGGKFFVANTDALKSNRFMHVVDNHDGTYTAAHGAQLRPGHELIDITNGGWFSVEDIENMRVMVKTSMPNSALLSQTGPDGKPLFVGDRGPVFAPTGEQNVCILQNASEPETPIASMFPNPGKSRDNMGVNFYLSFRPNPDVNVDVTAGYQQSQVLSTPMGDDVFSYNTREGKLGYATMNGHAKDLSFSLSFDFGPQNFAVGVPGYKMRYATLNGGVEYTFKVGGLGIKPSFGFGRAQYHDYLPVFNDETHANGDYSWHYERDFDQPAPSMTRLYGFFDGDALIYSLCPSLRLDYNWNGTRLIAAFLGDKRNIPNKWNNAWQFVAARDINDKHFVRLVYGHANRGAIMLNSSAQLQWLRTNMQPGRIIYNCNEEASLGAIDNVELGYRVKPTHNILLDAELFYSYSKNYGALMASKTQQATKTEYLMRIMEENAMPVLADPASMAAIQSNPQLMQQVIGNLAGLIQSTVESRTYLKYDILPYKVHQMGISMNMDWIISPKLIAKVNANVQRTIINDYYKYSQTKQMASQIGQSQLNLSNNLSGIVKDLVRNVAAAPGDAETKKAFFGNILRKMPVEEFREQVGFDNMTDDEKETLFAELEAAGLSGQSYKGLDTPLPMRYALKYGVREDDGDFFFGSANAFVPELEQHHKHKATPALYGMIGIIYKPFEKISVSAFANYIGKRTYETQYGSEELKDRLTVNMKLGYVPTSGVEFFFNAHNLFNTKSREFTLCDEIGGLYTFGVNFGF